MDITPELEVRPVPTFRDVLMQATFAPNRAISDSVNEIDLGIFGDEGRELIEHTLKDPRKREYGKLVTIIGSTRKMRLYKMVAGTEEDTDYGHDIEYLLDPNPSIPRHVRVPESHEAHMHSHPEDISPSSGDLKSVLVGDVDPRATTSAFVVTPVRFVVVFRGRNTPQFTLTQAEEKTAMWERAIKERIEQFRTPAMPVSEQLILNEKARAQMLRQIGQKYDLKIFKGPLHSNTITLQT